MLRTAVIIGACCVFLFAGTAVNAQKLLHIDTGCVHIRVNDANQQAEVSDFVPVASNEDKSDKDKNVKNIPTPTLRKHYLMDNAIPKQHPALKDFNGLGSKETAISNAVKLLPNYNQQLVKNFRKEVKKPLVASRVVEDNLLSQSGQPVSSNSGTEELTPEALKQNTKTLRINLSGALATAIQNNPEFRAKTILPRITATHVGEQLSVFDTKLTGNLQTTQGTSHYFAGNSYGLAHPKWEGNNSLQTELGLEKITTCGGMWSFKGSFADSRQHQLGALLESPQDMVAITFQQSLLQGRGIGVNLALVQQARLQTVVSRQEFSAYAQQFVANVELAALDYIASVKKLELLNRMKKIQERNTQELIEKIEHGKEAAVQQYAYLAQIGDLEVQRLNTCQQVTTYRILVLSLVYPKSTEYWKHDVEICYDLVPPGDTLLSADAHIQQALARRPDIVQARLQWEQGRLNVMTTQNGLLPKLDFFTEFRWGNSGTYDSTDTRTLLQNQSQATAGLQLSYILGNRDARAKNRAAQLSSAQHRLAIENLENQVKTNVYRQFLAVVQQFQLIAATNLAAISAYHTYLAEVEKQKQGKSNTILVSSVQDNYIKEALGEIDAVIEFRKALVNLYLADGSILERRGVCIQ
jgi:outer membrane protein TolC